MKLKQIKRTVKLNKAIEILSEDVRGADCSEHAFYLAMVKGKFKPQALYKILAAMRYTWDAKHKYWKFKPRHLKSTQRIFKIVRVIDDELFTAEER